VQCASLVFCYSRVVFARVYPTWNRFWVKVFLTEALIKMGGASGVCMLDNSSVIVARGNGKDAVMAPEMAAFGARFGFEFRAHKLGDANRSAHVERRFSYIENNFYAGRDFSDVEDLNRQLDAWCDKVNGTLRKDLGAKPIELFAAEQVALRRLPLHVPEVYLPHRRTVDTEGYINLHHNRYSAPTALIDHEVEVHETKDRVRILNGQRLVCEHIRDEDGAAKRRTLPEHARDATWKAKKRAPSPEETRLSASSTALAEMVTALKKRHGGRAVRPLQRLHRMWMEYPPEPLNSALRVALDHGLLDLERVETLVLRHVAGDFFRIPRDPDDDEES